MAVVTKNLDKFIKYPLEVEMAIAELAKASSVRARQWAQENALWQDQTGSARKLLKDISLWEGKEILWGVMHRVDYGEYLETAFDGKYAILKKAVDNELPNFYKALKDMGLNIT